MRTLKPLVARGSESPIVAENEDTKPLVARGSESPRGSSVVPMIQPGSQSQGRQDSSEQLGMTGVGGTNSLEKKNWWRKKNSPRGASNYHTY